MESIEVIINHHFSEETLDELRGISSRLHLRQETLRTADDYRSLDLSRVQILYAAGALPENAEQLPQLRWVQLHMAGMDSLVDHPLCHTSIRFTNTSGIHAKPMAEHAFGNILAWNCMFQQHIRNQERADFPTADRLDAFWKPELGGKTLGVVGYGSIGREVGRLGAAFGMHVLACNRTGHQIPNRRWSEPGVGDPDGHIPQAWYGPEQIRPMLAECDFVVSTLPLTHETRGLIGSQELAAMKPAAYLVNVSRGGVIDQDALIAALEEGSIAGAGLDVTTPEPLPPDNPLWRLQNVSIFPHISAMTVEYDRRAASIFQENLRRFVAEEPLINRVNWDLGY